MAFHHLSLEEIKKQLDTDFEKGLSEQEVQARLSRYGENSLPEKKPPSGLQILLAQFKSPLVYILLFAFLISFLLAHWEDALVISGALLVNTILGFVQEKKALNIMEELKKLVHPEAIVIREGKEQLIEAAVVVPGDIIVLNAGDKVPADARLIEENDLEAVEAALTGESVPSAKNVGVFPEDTPVADRENMVFLGTVLSRGKGRAVVTATGEQTELGKIALLVAETEEEETPLQRQLSRFSIYLTRLVAIICVLIFLEGLWQQKDVFEMLATVVAIAVAAIPEGLLVALTVILALGMQRILKQKGLVRHLIAAETLGSTSIICTDKTGTLTEGEMQVAYVHVSGLMPDGEEDEAARGWALRIAALCNNAVVENYEEDLKNWRIIGDPTEKALLLAAVQSGRSLDHLRETYSRLAELPFNEDRKFMATLHEAREESRRRLMVKGAPELVLQRSSHVFVRGKEVVLTEGKRKEIVQQFEDLSRKGLRVLGLAYGPWDKDKQEITEEDVGGLVYVASVSLKDPLRSGVKETIDLCRRAGVRPILVTGDHLLTARAIAEEAGMEMGDKNVIEGKELDRMTHEELEERIREFQLYARVTPEHKLRIIEAWQKQGEVVAMTGDGVNDAPALKKADIGVALGSGTEVAKEASDLVLLDDRFSTIVAAVKEGRVIFDNLRKVITYLLADSFSEMILIAGGLATGLGVPITAAQILWINLITDGLPDLALTMEPEESDVMERPPRREQESILNTEMKVIIFVIGLFTDLILLALFWYLSQKGLDAGYVRTFIFVALGLDSLFYVFACKSLRRPLWHINPFSNRWLVAAILGGWVLQVLPVYWEPLQRLLGTTSLPAISWVYLIGLAGFKLFCIELVKEYFIKNDAAGAVVFDQ